MFLHGFGATRKKIATEAARGQNPEREPVFHCLLEPGRVTGWSLDRGLPVDSKYILGITELDSQHEEIETVLFALQAAMDDKDRWHTLLDDLCEKLRFHFYAEESIMKVFAYPEYQEHRKSHLEILKTFESYRNTDLTDADIATRRDYPLQLFLEQILSQDLRFAAFLNRNRERLGIQ